MKITITERVDHAGQPQEDLTWDNVRAFCLGLEHEAVPGVSRRATAGHTTDPVQSAGMLAELSAAIRQAEETNRLNAMIQAICANVGQQQARVAMELAQRNGRTVH